MLIEKENDKEQNYYVILSPTSIIKIKRVRTH